MTTSGTYSLYKITNSLNGKTYIGFTSRSLLTRWKEHVRHAKKHANNGHFYRAIRKYGQDVFLMELLETFKTPNEAKEAEILFIAKMKPEYNSTKGGDGSPGHFVSEESRKKMGEIHKNNKYNLGRKWTEKQKLTMSQKLKGRPSPPLTDKMSFTRAMNFKKAAIKRRKKVICVNDNIEYDSISFAAANYNLCKTTISAICNGKRNSAYGFKFRFVEAV